jgi:flagellar protein FliO/FliZ
MKFRIVLAAAAWIGTTDSAFAQAAAQSTLAPASPMASMLQGLIGLAIVIGVIFVAAWLLKRIGPRARSGGIVRVVGGASVGPREKVVVVRFGHQTLLLGVAQGHVSLLHTADTIDAEPDDATASPAPRFIDRLRAARSNG